MLGGRLAARLRELRRSGASFEEINRQLHREAGLVVSTKTLTGWVKQLHIDDPEAA